MIAETDDHQRLNLNDDCQIESRIGTIPKFQRPHFDSCSSEERRR